MRDLFLYLYADLLSLHNAQFQLIFDHALYYTNGYTLNGFIFILVPLIIALLFYFLYHNPFAKYWHWLIALTVCITIVGIFTHQYNVYLIFSTYHPDLRLALNTPDTGYKDFAKNLILNLTIINIFLSTIMFALYSLVFKQFSKSQGHIPI